MLKLTKTTGPHTTFGGQELEDVPKVQLFRDGEQIGEMPWDGTEEELEKLQSDVDRSVEQTSEDEVTEELTNGFVWAAIWGFDLALDAQSAAQEAEKEARTLL